MDRQNFYPSNVTAWSQVQHAISEEQQAGQAGQEGFEQHLAEARPPDPAPVSSRRRRHHPNLSTQDRDIIDKAIAQYAGQGKARTINGYAAGLRRLINEIRDRDQSTDLRDRQSLAKHAKAWFPSNNDITAGLHILRAYYEPGHVADGAQRTAAPSAEDALLIERLTNPSGLTQLTFVAYQRALRKFSERLKGVGQTISELDHDSRVAFARKLLPKSTNLISALGTFRDQLDAKQSSGAGGPRETGGDGALSPRSGWVPAEVWTCSMMRPRSRRPIHWNFSGWNRASVRKFTDGRTINAPPQGWLSMQSTFPRRNFGECSITWIIHPCLRQPP
ncbi:hypothetical protein GA0061099_10518 [Bradyrhizobium yuanmingense]|uniref:Core-binding (CB) domain-containing protein n=1 Tax=Bradyrhizobium yuanmingense TaxID=108015 RepID=A0A1C3XM13_9BRAD|nr:hypothetical protein [Bradyrhizobium yuanmingense]TWI16538.1 hypothetical protein IQ15_07670 [Bradyrhizobium yuanmingense]SCB53185.1 hypothetical protein GA0061099_10518 [Bradyrhizobium yuanmingense]